jgi:hypothetical protein
VDDFMFEIVDETTRDGPTPGEFGPRRRLHPSHVSVQSRSLRPTHLGFEAEQPASQYPPRWTGYGMPASHSRPTTRASHPPISIPASAGRRRKHCGVR